MCAAAGNCSKPRDGGGCCAFARVYSEPRGAYEGNQTWWNFSNADTQQYFIDTVIFGRSNGLGNEVVDGCYTDDPGGQGEEHGFAAGRMGITYAEEVGFYDITVKTLRKAQERMVAEGKFNWELFTQTGPLPNTSAACSAYMRGLCSGQRHGVAWIHTPSGVPTLGTAGGVPFAMADATQQAAAFLIGRGDYAWMGYGE